MSNDGAALIRSKIRDVPDFPKPGILFKDITPLVGDARALAVTLDLLAAPFASDQATGRIDAVVGIESRGFIFGGAVARQLGAGFVPVRKRGKLPFKADRFAYALEYGEAELEVHVDAIARGQRVLIVDDLLATGGTAAAAAELTRRQGGVVVAFAFVVELDFLGGGERLKADSPGAALHAIVRYGAGE